MIFNHSPLKCHSSGKTILKGAPVTRSPNVSREELELCLGKCKKPADLVDLQPTRVRNKEFVNARHV